MPQAQKKTAAKFSPSKYTPSKVTPIKEAIRPAVEAPKAFARATLSALEDSQHSAEHAIKAGSDTIRDFATNVMSNSAQEVQKIQEKWFAISREASENMSRSFESASHAFNDVLEVGKENMEAAMEISDASTETFKTMANECVNFANELFAENVEISKDFFSCRTMHDLFDLQSKLVKSNLDACFTQFSKLMEMAMEFTSETAEPINERFSETTERLTKAFASAV